MVKFKTLFFNAGGTLLQLKNNTLPRLYSTHITEILGKEVTPESIYQAFRKAEEWTLSRKDWSLFSDLDQRKYQNIFYNHLGIKNRKDINRIEYELAERIEINFVLEDGAKTILREMKSKFNLGLISNWDESIFSILDELGILNYFESITISEDVGVSKPDPEIFRYALNDFPDVKPRESVYIGDEYQIDIVPARKLKIFTVFYDKGPSGLHGHPFQPNLKGVRISKLTELPRILQKYSEK